MIIGELQPFPIVLLDGELKPMGEARAPGMHLGTVLKAMRVAAKQKSGPIEGEDPGARPEIGFLFERAASLMWAGVPYAVALEAAWKDYCGTVLELDEYQSKLAQDGVQMTPDGLMQVDGQRSLASFKLTWKSMKKWREDTLAVNAGGSAEHFWSWLFAEEAYARAYMLRDAQETMRCRFFIFWVNGDYTYKPGHGPQATYCDVFFSTAEMEQDWRVMLRYRDWIKRNQDEEEKRRNEAAALSGLQDQADGHF